MSRPALHRLLAASLLAGLVALALRAPQAAHAHPDEALDPAAAAPPASPDVATLASLSWDPPEPARPDQPVTVRLHVAGALGTLTASARPFDLAAALEDVAASLRAPDDEGTGGPGDGSPDALFLGSGRDPLAHATGEALVLHPGVVASSVASSAGRSTRAVTIPATFAPGESLLLEARGGGLVARTILVRERLVVLAFPGAPPGQEPGGLALAVLDPATGEPATGTIEADELAQEIRGARSHRFVRSAGAVTDAGGTATLERDPRFPRVLVRARSSGRVAWALVGPGIEAPPAVSEVVDAFWERGLARPGEVARCRLSVLDAAPERRGRGEVPRRPAAGEHLLVVLRDEAGHAFEKDLALDGNGVALLEVPLPADARGGLELRARFRNEPVPVHGDLAAVGVAREAQLRLELSGPARAAAGSTVTYEARVRDLWGAPLAGAVVRARLVGEDGGLLAHEVVATDGSGTAALSWVARGHEGEHLWLDASARDATGREGAASTGLHLVLSEPHATLWADRRFAGAGDEVAVVVDVRGAGGKRVETRGHVTVRDAAGAVVAEPALEAKDGRGFVKVKLPVAGVYDVAYLASESAPGEPPVRATGRVFALGADGDLAPLPTGTTLSVEPEHPSYAPLETARLLVRGAPGSHALLVARDSLGRARPGFPRALALPRGTAIAPVELDPSWIAGGEVEALSLVGGRLARASARVVVRGPVEAPIVELSVDRLVFKPGEKPNVKVHVEQRDGLAFRRAVVELALEDEGSAVAGERARSAPELAPPPRPLEGSPGVAPTRHPEGVRAVGGVLVIAPREDRDPGLPLVLEGTSVAPQPPAGFLVLETNENGDAQVAVPLPGVAGKWRLRARVLSRENGPPGAGELVLATRKRLALDVGVPERLEVGETVALAVVVANEGEKAVDVQVSVAAKPDGALEIEGEPTRSLSVPARSSSRALVNVKTKRAGRVKLDVKLAAPGEDETRTRTLLVESPPALEPMAASLALVGSDVAATGTATLMASPSSHVLVRVATPAALLGDLIAALTAEGEDPGRAFVAALLARRALDARGEAWDAVAKRLGVAPDETLVSGEPGKGPRDPRRSPLFSKARLEGLTKDGLASLAARETPEGYGWQPGSPAELEATARAVETLVLAKDVGAPVEPERLARAVASLEKLLGASTPKPAPDAHALARARADVSLALAGVGVLLESPLPGSDAEVLHLLAALRRGAKGEPLERARVVLASEPVRKLDALARRIELALALGDPVSAHKLARAAATPALWAPGALEGTDELAHALAALVLADKAPVPPGSVHVVVGAGGRALDLKLAADDPLLSEAAAIASVATRTQAGVPIALERRGKGALALVATSLREPVPAARPVLVATASWQRLERRLASEAGRRWLRERWQPGTLDGPAHESAFHEGDVVRLELDLAADSPLSPVRLQVPLPACLEVVPGTLEATGFRATVLARDGSDALELTALEVAPGSRRVTLEARVRLAGDFRPGPLRVWLAGLPVSVASPLALHVAARP